MEFFNLNNLDKLNGIERIGYVFKISLFIIITLYSLYDTANRPFHANLPDYILYYVAHITVLWAIPVYVIKWLYKILLPWIVAGFHKR